MIQKEGLVIWDAFIDNKYLSNPYMALGTADGPTMAYLNSLVGHQGTIGCWLYCPFLGCHKGLHYYPVCLKLLDDMAGSDHNDLDPSKFASKTFHNYKEQLEYIIASQNTINYKNCWLKTGVVKLRIFLGLQSKHTLKIPWCFRYDIMHLISLNIPDLLLSLWCGTITGDKEDCLLWDWAILKDKIWIQHGHDVTSMASYLPGSFDCPPRNPVEKINSRYKAWEYLMYALGPGLFYNVLPKKYWQNYASLSMAYRSSSK